MTRCPMNTPVAVPTGSEAAGAAAASTSADPITYRPSIHDNAVEMFDPDANVEECVTWWERFVYPAALGMWPEKMKLRQLHCHLPGQLRG
ncbi:hypothetical protein GQ600_16934 [Phytophthora cactorum]|nr:hypothetical protein GQ600_16934 [Phytophthora cactorum]